MFKKGQVRKPKQTESPDSFKKRFDAATTCYNNVLRNKEMLERINDASKCSGRSNIIKSITGQKISASAAIVAKCFDCCGHYIDGRKDCEVSYCPLYPWMPYGLMRKKYVRPEFALHRDCDSPVKNKPNKPLQVTLKFCPECASPYVDGHCSANCTTREDSLI